MNLDDVAILNHVIAGNLLPVEPSRPPDPNVLQSIGKLTVDTVERFQGQEREAMIVSFVVSDDAFIDRLGAFLTYPQRLNVAVTRARTKVVLVHSRRFRKWLERNAAHDENSALALSLLEAAR